MQGPTERHNREQEHIDARKLARARRIAIGVYLRDIATKYPGLTVYDAYHKEA